MDHSLKQAGRKWYDMLCKVLIDIGFQRSAADPAVFFICTRNDITILFIHVNDTTMTGSSSSLIDKLEHQIGETFEITHLGPVSWLLGLAISRDCCRCTLAISQETYINTVVHHFHLEDAKSLSVLIDANTRLLKEDCLVSDEDKREMKTIPYCKAVEVLNWIAVGTRPDIAFVISHLVQFLENPG